MQPKIAGSSRHHIELTTDVYALNAVAMASAAFVDYCHTEIVERSQDRIVISVSPSSPSGDTEVLLRSLLNYALDASIKQWFQEPREQA